MSRDADSRTLAEHLFRYIEELRPDYIQIENVVEFMEWGPLMIKTTRDPETGAEYRPLDIKRDRKTRTTTVAPVWVPDPESKGTLYRQWVADVCSRGYRFEHRVLNAADYGAYTSRVRYFGQFARPELPMAWPRQTHAKNPETQHDLFTAPLKPWRAVREVLDFDDRGESIFGRKKPLVDATLDRIHAGLVKFVAGGKDAFLVKYNSLSQAGKYIPPSVDAPCPTIATQGRLGVARASFLSKHFGGAGGRQEHPGNRPGRNHHDGRPPRVRICLLRERLLLLGRAAGADADDQRPLPTGAAVHCVALFGRRPSYGRRPAGAHAADKPEATACECPLPAEPAIPVGRRLGRCSVLHADCPDGQATTLPGIGRTRRAGMAHPTGRHPGDGTAERILHRLRHSGHHDADAANPGDETHSRLRRRLRTAGHARGAEEVPRERRSNGDGRGIV